MILKALSGSVLVGVIVNKASKSLRKLAGLSAGLAFKQAISSLIAVAAAVFENAPES